MKYESDFELRQQKARATRILRERKGKKIGLSASKGRGCRVSDRDDAAKIRLGYTNPRSYVRLDGSERLFGEDWKKRKREIWERGGGKCEKIVSYDECNVELKGSSLVGIQAIRCRSEMHDPHHIVKRSTRRDDRASNLIGLCRMHHDLL